VIFIGMENYSMAQKQTDHMKGSRCPREEVNWANSKFLAIIKTYA